MDNPEFPSLRLINHPLVEHKLTQLRNRFCSSTRFHRIMRELGMLLAYKVTENLELKSVPIQTPVAPDEVIQCKVLAGNRMVVVPILRAGMALVEGMMTVMPSMRSGHIGIRRDKNSAEAKIYMVSLPNIEKDTEVILVDPDIATGTTACRAVDILKRVGVEGRNIRLAAILVSREGMAQLTEKHPDVTVFAVSLEEGLNDKRLIVPGFGDAGDRLFDTTSG